jgi:glycerol-3-phosphate acyltransferase PlsY
VPLAWAALIGYGIGSLPIGFLLARRASGVDVRTVGSGNVGAANVYRTAGRRLGVLVMVLDALKGAGSVLTARALIPQPVEPAAAVAGLGAILGHVFPIWLRFRGGKGVAAACGVFAVLAPWSTAIAALVFLATVALGRYVSLGSMLATAVLPVAEWLRPGNASVDLAAAGAALLILFRHRGNIVRLIRGVEPRLGDRIGRQEH